MRVINSIPYNPELGFRGLGDLYLPDDVTPETKAVLTIHGGGWCSQEKSTFAGVALWLCQELKMAVYNINYRLSSKVPWPACGDDCLEAGRFFLDARIPEFQGFARSRIFVMGGSAGGHLALMTGLRLPPERVAGIVSISGIADVEPDFAANPNRYETLFGHVPSREELASIAPANFLTPSSPAILCTHDYRDNVVPIASAERFLEAVHGNGTAGESYYYEKDEHGFSHRIWIPDSTPHRLYPDIEAHIADFLARQK